MAFSSDYRGPAAHLRESPMAPMMGRGHMAFLCVTEPLDLAGSVTFLDRAHALSRTCRCLVVDLERCEFADSCGIRALLGLAALQEEEGGELRLVVRRESRVERALILLELMGRLHVYPTLADACNLHRACRS